MTELVGVFYPLQDALSAFFIGTAVATALWGAVCVQVWHYYTSSTNDHGAVKVMVALVFVLDTAHQVFISETLYTYTIASFGDPIALLDLPPHTAMLQGAFANVIAFVVQGYFVCKIWELSKCRWLLAVPVAILSVAQTITGIIEVIAIARSNTWLEFLANSRTDTPLGFGIAFAVNLAIALVMSYLFIKDRSQYASADTVISRTLVFAFATNAITSLLFLGVVLASLLQPQNIFFLPLYFVGVRVNSNSFLAGLNMRPYLTHTSESRVRADSDTRRLSLPVSQRVTNSEEHPWAVQADSSTECRTEEK